MNTRKLFSMSEKEIKEYFEQINLREGFTRALKVFPTTVEENLFGLISYSKPAGRRKERKLIKKFPTLYVENNRRRIMIGLRDDVIIVAIEPDYKTVKKVRKCRCNY